ncbi:outer membrane beta-barrel protein [Pedosphaera parvula]|nr:outer membrane beta-barrel protein [Pedosphaera parvula]
MKIKTLITTIAVGMFGATLARAEDTTASTVNTYHIWQNPQGWWAQTYVYTDTGGAAGNVSENVSGNVSGAPYLFNANELTLDLFGSYLKRQPITEGRFFSHNGLWGGGVGANYFFTRYVGIGADTSFQDGASDFVDHVGGNLILRLPIEYIRSAPYIFGGGGFKFDPRDQWFYNAGGGWEFRFNPHLGLFADGRFVWLTRNTTDRNELLLRTGLRVAF